MSQEPKKGIRTTEFWLTAVTSVLSLLVLAGVLGPDESSRIVSTIKDILAGVIALFSVIAYISGRVKLKGGDQK